MKNHFLLLGMGVISCGAILLAQTLPTTVPTKPQGGYLAVHQVEFARRTFKLHGENYISSLAPQDAQSGDAWDPSLPIPITLEHAEDLARYELKKLVDDEILWRFSEFSFARLTGTNSYLWYFAITLKPIAEGGKETSDSFTLLMNAKGEPGRVGHLGPVNKR